MRDHAFRRMQMVVGRNVLFAIVLCQYAGHDPDDRDTWPTVGRLHQLAEDFRLASRRTADDFVARLRYVGYIEDQPAPDRRLRLLRPTDAMWQHDIRNNAMLFAPLHRIYPGPAFQRAIDHDPVFNLAQRRVGLSLLGIAAGVLERSRILQPILTRDGGYGVMVSLARAADTAGGTVADIVPADIADWFGVSRTHVRDVLAELEAMGLIATRKAGRGQHYELLPRFYELFNGFLADVMSAQDVLAEVAMADLRARGGA